MKGYLCDVCFCSISDPVLYGMKEFEWIENGKHHKKIKHKIHLCNYCFQEMRSIAYRRKGGEE